jgi:uncharacterized membrane protein
MHLGPAARYKHDHLPIRDASADFESSMSLGDRVADRVATLVGSWPFIIVQSALLAFWIIANVWLLLNHNPLKPWDPYPFILLNLALSFQAAYTGPIVMMSQNRQSAKDRLEARDDYQCNLKAEEEIRIIMEHLAHQDELLKRILDKLEIQLS